MDFEEDIQESADIIIQYVQKISQFVGDRYNNITGQIISITEEKYDYYIILLNIQNVSNKTKERINQNKDDIKQKLSFDNTEIISINIDENIEINYEINIDAELISNEIYVGSGKIVVYDKTNLPQELFNKAKKMFYSVKPSQFKNYSNSMRRLGYEAGYDTVPNNFKSFISDAANLMINDGYSINPNKYLLELHDYTIDSRDSVTKPPFIWHRDDHGGVSYPVNTMLVYLRKDPELVGGNLLYSTRESLPERGRELLPKDFVKIIVQPPMIISMTGNIVHAVEDMYGYGKRQLVLLQFERV